MASGIVEWVNDHHRSASQSNVCANPNNFLSHEEFPLLPVGKNCGIKTKIFPNHPCHVREDEFTTSSHKHAPLLFCLTIASGILNFRPSNLCRQIGTWGA